MPSNTVYMNSIFFESKLSKRKRWEFDVEQLMRCTATTVEHIVSLEESASGPRIISGAVGWQSV